MSASSVQISSSCEGESEFDFDEWVNANGLSGIKQLFLKHGMDKPDTLCVTSPSFQHLMSDPKLLPNAHFIPIILAAFKTISDTKPYDYINNHTFSVYTD